MEPTKIYFGSEKKEQIFGHYILISHSVKRKFAFTNFQTCDLRNTQNKWTSDLLDPSYLQLQT